MLNPDFRDALSAFNAEEVEYLLVGAFALAAHGLPRATGDIDLWVRPSAENAERVWRALVAFGAPGEMFRREDFTRPDMVVQIGVPPARVDVLTAIEGVEFDDAWRERVVLTLDGLAVPVIGRDHLLRNKQATGRPKDRLDAEVLARMAPRPRRGPSSTGD